MSACNNCSSSSNCSTQTCRSAEKSANLSPAALSMQDLAIAATLRHIRHVIFVVSGKGGVGKSSVSVNIAAALAAMGHKTGILDTDLHGPSVAGLLGVRDRMRIEHENERISPMRHSENLSFISIDSFLKNKDSAVIWRGPKKAGAIRQFLADVKWGELDFLLIDSPPGTGDEHLTVLKAIPDAQCVVVTTPQEVSLADVRKALNFLEKVDADILGLVENMSGLTCPQCGARIELFKRGGGEALARARGIRFLGAIPLDPATVVAADRGEPVVLLSEDTPAKKSFMAVARRIAELLETPARPLETGGGA